MFIYSTVTQLISKNILISKVSGHFDERQFDEKYNLAKKILRKVRFVEIFLAKDYLTR